MASVTLDLIVRLALPLLLRLCVKNMPTVLLASHILRTVRLGNTAARPGSQHQAAVLHVQQGATAPASLILKIVRLATTAQAAAPLRSRT